MAFGIWRGPSTRSRDEGGSSFRTPHHYGQDRFDVYPRLGNQLEPFASRASPWTGPAEDAWSQWRPGAVAEQLSDPHRGRGAHSRPTEALSTLAVLGLNSKGVVMSELERAFQELPGLEHVRCVRHADAAFFKFVTPALAAQALDTAVARRCGAEWARRNSFADPDHARPSGSSVRELASMPTPDWVEHRRNILTITKISEKGISFDDLMCGFQGLPGFVEVRVMSDADLALVRFSSRGTADEACSSAAAQRFGVEITEGASNTCHSAPEQPSESDHRDIAMPLAHGALEGPSPPASRSMLQWSVSSPVEGRPVNPPQREVASEGVPRGASSSGSEQFSESLVVCRGGLSIFMSGRGLDDGGAEAWCRWALDHIPSLDGLAKGPHGLLVANIVDFSDNVLGDAGLHAVLSTLNRLGVGIQVLKLFRNSLGRASAEALASWVTVSAMPLQELHLSHNFVPQSGFEAIFGAIAKRPDYPAERPGGMGTAPLWFRLEYNAVDDFRALLISAERLLRRGGGEKSVGSGIPLGGKEDMPMICVIEDKVRRGCRNDSCRWSHCLPSHSSNIWPSSSRRPCPLVHVTYPAKQHLDVPVPLAASKWDMSSDVQSQAKRWHLIEQAPTTPRGPQEIQGGFALEEPVTPPPPSPKWAPALKPICLQMLHPGADMPSKSAEAPMDLHLPADAVVEVKDGRGLPQQSPVAAASESTSSPPPTPTPRSDADVSAAWSAWNAASVCAAACGTSAMAKIDPLPGGEPSPQSPVPRKMPMTPSAVPALGTHRATAVVHELDSQLN
mmetsp:Transcript_89705/g.225607  ORF Transcript_89705/g.225607 Transcript_89705/m.225607 type:complete len:789 (-) Transcript_89705:120-2486(-)